MYFTLLCRNRKDFLKNLLLGMKVAFDTARSTQNLAMVIMSLIYRTCKTHYHLKGTNLNITGTFLSSLKAYSPNGETYGTISQHSLCTHKSSLVNLSCDKFIFILDGCVFNCSVALYFLLKRNF